LSTRVIDNVSIKNKLIKADPYGQEPSDSIIGLTIINEISRQLRHDNIEVTRIIYFFKNLEFEIANNFKNLIDSQSEREHTIILTIIHSNVKIEQNLLDLFSSVNIIKK
jgi:hypothetical protein